MDNIEDMALRSFTGYWGMTGAVAEIRWQEGA